MVESSGTVQPWRDSAAPPERRADTLLAALTAEDKIAIAMGEFEKVAHLGMPALRYTDGPNGVRGPDTVTAFPAFLRSKPRTLPGRHVVAGRTVVWAR